MDFGCISCGDADLETHPRVEFAGVEGTKKYCIVMPGLVCPKCKFKTVEGKDFAQLCRLVREALAEEEAILNGCVLS